MCNMDLEDKKVAISVVVPIYNVEKYVDKCIETIVEQTFKNIEIILVDDGSTDKSGRICEQWGEKDNRIRVIHQANQGLSAARNTGTKTCCGEYIAYVDGDDELEPEYLSSLWGQTKDGQIDMVICEYGEIIDGEKRLHGDQVTVEYYSPADYLLSDHFLMMACCKLIRRNIAEKFPFPVGKIHEDVAVIPRMIYESNEIAYLGKSLYFYNWRSDSINTKERYYMKHLDMLPFMKDNIVYFEKSKNEKLIAWARRQYIFALFEQYGKVKCYYPNQKKELTVIKAELKKNCRDIKTDKTIKITTRLLLQGCAYIPELWKKMMG